MAESVGQSGSSNLEQEIAQIERDLASKRADLEFQQQSGQIQEIPKEKETLREVVQEQYSMEKFVERQLKKYGKTQQT